MNKTLIVITGIFAFFVAQTFYFNDFSDLDRILILLLILDVAGMILCLIKMYKYYKHQTTQHINITLIAIIGIFGFFITQAIYVESWTERLVFYFALDVFGIGLALNKLRFYLRRI